MTVRRSLVKKKPPIEEEVLRLEALYAEQAAAEAAVRKQRQNILEMMDSQEIREITATAPDGGLVRVSVIEPESTVLDENRFRRAIGPAMWKAVTKTVVDNAALGRAVKSKQIDPAVLVRFSSTVPGTRYLSAPKRVMSGRRR